MYGRIKSRDDGHYYARERPLLTHFLWDRTFFVEIISTETGIRRFVWWCGGRWMVAGQVPVWWSPDKYFFILKIFQQKSLHCDWH
jgi:hypothetical protein